MKDFQSPIVKHRPSLKSNHLQHTLGLLEEALQALKVDIGMLETEDSLLEFRVRRAEWLRKLVASLETRKP